MGYSTKSVLCARAYPTDFLSGGNVLQLNRSEDFSVVVWFKTSDTTSAEQRLFCKSWSSAGSPKGYMLTVLSTGVVRWDMIYTNITNHLACTTTSTGWNDGDWHCLVLTHDTALGAGTVAAMKVYIDGSLQTLATVYDTLTTDIWNNSSNFTIGAAMFDTDGFNGYIDSTGVYRGKVLDATEVGWIYNVGITQDLKHANAPSGLTHWWRMGETITGDGEIADEGNGPFPSGYSPLTQSIELNNGSSDEYADFGLIPAADFLNTDACTFGAWVKLVDQGGNHMQTVLCKHRTGGADIALFLHVIRTSGNPPVIYAQYGTGPVYGYARYSQPPSWMTRCSAGLWDGKWHLVMFRRASGGSNPTVFVDGVRQSESLGNYQPLPGLDADGTFTVGAYKNGGSPVNVCYGNVCHAFIYNAEVTIPEMQAIFNEGVPPDLSVVGPTGNLVFWSGMGDGDAIGAGNVLDLSGGGHHGTLVNGESGDFVTDVPTAPFDLVLEDGASVQNEAPVGNEYSSYYDAYADPHHTLQPAFAPTFSALLADPDDVPEHAWQPTTDFSTPRWFRMRGIDTTCPPSQQPAYVYWTVTGYPDWDASELSLGDLPCGTDPSTDVVDIQIAGGWLVPG